MTPTAILVALTIVLPSFAFAQNKLCRKHLVIIETTQEKWNPGVLKDNSEQAGGIKYQMKIKVKKTGSLKFQNLITPTENLEIEVIKDGKRNFSGSVSKGDEVVIIARTDKRKPQASPDPEDVKTLKKENLSFAIIYSIKDQTYLHPIKDFNSEQSGKLIQ